MVFEVAIDLPIFNVIDGRGAEVPRRVARILALADRPYIGRIIGTGRGRDRRVFKQALFNAQALQIGSREEHDVHQLLLDDAADLLE